MYSSISRMAEAALAQISRVTSRTTAGNVGRMTDEQLISLRGIFQAIDSGNNGSITPSLLAGFYAEEGVKLDIRGVEDLFDTVGAEHSLPFRRFLVFAPSFISKLPATSKWRVQESASSAEASSSGASESKEDAKAAENSSLNQALNRQIVENQATLDHLLEDISAGESTLAAINLKIQAAMAQLSGLETQIAQKEAQLGAFNLITPVRAKTPLSSAPKPIDDAPHSPSTDATVPSSDEHRKGPDTEEADDSSSESESEDTAEEPSGTGDYWADRNQASPEEPSTPTATAVVTTVGETVATPVTASAVDATPTAEEHQPQQEQHKPEKTAPETTPVIAKPEEVVQISKEPAVVETPHTQEPAYEELVESPRQQPPVEHVVEVTPAVAHVEIPVETPVVAVVPVVEPVVVEEPKVAQEPVVETKPEPVAHETPRTPTSESGSTEDTPRKHKHRKDKDAGSEYATSIVALDTAVADGGSESEPDTPKDKKRRKHKERGLSSVRLIDASSSEDVSAPSTPKDKTPKTKRKDKKEKEKEKEKEKKDKTDKEKKKRKSAILPSLGTTAIAAAIGMGSKSNSKKNLKDGVSEGEVALEHQNDVLNASATGLSPLRTPTTAPQIAAARSPRSPRNPDSPTSGIAAAVGTSSTPNATADAELPGEKMALIDKTYFASIDVKLQAIIDGLQPHQQILDLSYFNLVVYIQGLNTQLMTVSTKLPTVSTVAVAVHSTSRKPSTVQLQPRITSKSSVMGIPSVSISPSSPTPPTCMVVKAPQLGYLVSGPYFSLATGDMLNALGDAVVQCLNSLLISIQESRSKSPNHLASLCSSWKAQLYQSICTAYHSMTSLIRGVTSDLAQYFFPSSPAPADDPALERPLGSVQNQIAMPPVNVNDEYMPDSVALEILQSQQLSDAQLLQRQEFIRLFSVYFGEGLMDNLLYTLDPWSTQSIPMKRFSEFLRLFGTVAGATCYRQLENLTNTAGFQGYLTEGVVLTLLEQQAPGTYCLWYNKVRPKFSVLNLSWFDGTKEIVNTSTITISSFSSPSAHEPTFNFGFDYEGLSVTAPTLSELLNSLVSISDPATITKPYTPQFPRSSVFHGDMDSPEAEALLAKEADGTLLFRLSSRRGSLAVSYVFRGKVGHTLLKIGFPDCYEYSGQVYRSIPEVIQGHAQIFKFIFDSSSLTRTTSSLPKIYL